MLNSIYLRASATHGNDTKRQPLSKTKSFFMINKIVLFGLLLVSCSQAVEPKNSEKIKTGDNQFKFPKTHTRDRDLYYEFILNLEKTLWSSDLFVKTDYNGRGWQLLDKNGKYIIRSADNFTKNRDTAVNYALTIITIDNYLTNKDGEDRTIQIPYRLSDGRASTIDLYFTYDKSKVTSMSYSEETLNLPFNYAIIVDYRSCFNDKQSFSWDHDRIVRYDLDCKENLEEVGTTLWKRTK